MLAFHKLCAILLSAVALRPSNDLAHSLAYDLANKDPYSVMSLTRWVDHHSYQELQTLYQNANPAPLTKGGTIDGDNANFIELLKQPKAANYVFVHSMLKTLKTLNDVVFTGENTNAKKDVDASRNLFRVILAENIAAHPVLSKALVGRFIDWKTLECAFDPSFFSNKQTMINEINYVIRISQINFDEAMTLFMRTNPELRKVISEQRGINADPRMWNLFGIAEGNADLAVHAARRAVENLKLDSGSSLNAKEYSEAETQKALGHIETVIKAKLIQAVGANSPIFSHYESTEHLVLSTEALDILRKISAVGKSDYIERVSAEFKRRLKLNISGETAILLRDYVAKADDFQPTIRSTKRTQIKLDNAKHGVWNFDLAGQNMANMYHTMGALAEAHAQGVAGHPNPGNLAFALTRKGETLATQRLERLKNNIAFALKTAGIQGELQETGDDISVVLAARVSGSQKQKFYQALASLPDPLSNYRHVDIPPLFRQVSEVDVGALSRESLKGENLEKGMRTALYGSVDSTVLKKAGFSVEIFPDKKLIRVDVISTPSAELESEVRKYLKDPKHLPDGYSIESIRTFDPTLLLPSNTSK